MNAIAVTVNKNFSLPLGVFLYGLAKFNFVHDIILYYDEYFEDIEKYKNVFPELKIKDKKVNFEPYKDLKWINYHRVWDLNPFYRYEIFKNSEYNKILYVDIDVVILGELNSVFDLEGDFSAVELAKVTNLSYVSPGQRGFNAGVMLIGKKYLNNEVFDELIKITKNTVFNGNQKVFNIFFKDKITFLDYKYNLTTDLLTAERIDEAKIIHFIGERKPWELKGIDSFCQYVRCLIGEHLIIKVYNLYLKEYNEALKRIDTK